MKPYSMLKSTPSFSANFWNRSEGVVSMASFPDFSVVVTASRPLLHDSIINCINRQQPHFAFVPDYHLLTLSYHTTNSIAKPTTSLI